MPNTDHWETTAMTLDNPIIALALAALAALACTIPVWLDRRRRWLDRDIFDDEPLP